jgi:hypothetical protein
MLTRADGNAGNVFHQERHRAELQDHARELQNEIIERVIAILLASETEALAGRPPSYEGHVVGDLWRHLAKRDATKFANIAPLGTIKDACSWEIVLRIPTGYLFNLNSDRHAKPCLLKSQAESSNAGEELDRYRSFRTQFTGNVQSTGRRGSIKALHSS